MNILLSSAGRRAAFAKLVRHEAARFGGKVFAVDSSPTSAACRVCDDWQRVPHCTDPSYITQLRNLCVSWEIDIVIPLIDTELPVLSSAKPYFRDVGTEIAVSGPATVGLATDKLTFAEFLTSHDLPTPLTVTAEPERIEASLQARALTFPLVMKPRTGSGSVGIQQVGDIESLRFYLPRLPGTLVQQLIRGTEFTVNIYVSREKTCLAAVPHKRLETRGGEVSKCVTVRLPGIEELASQLVAALPDPYGPLCFQLFVDEQGSPQIIELNSRFGGGYPVAHEAGANFIRCLLEERAGVPRHRRIEWKEGVAMLRWDDAVFTTAADIGESAWGPQRSPLG
jgi:carbamoyl-phosphate synthase large subunit